jgi:hypothetical protein
MISKLQTGTFVLVGILAATAIHLPAVLAQEMTTFSAQLSGQEEVPPVETQATGMAQFEIMGDDSISYTVNASDIQAVTAGHIHNGPAGENGDVVVTLFSYDAPQDGVSETGTISAGDLEGPMSGAQLSDLVDMMNSGDTYVNIHTEQNQGGEIRGQLAPAGQ